MKFKICGEYEDGSIDSTIIEADTIEEIQQLAKEFVESKDFIDFWSEQHENNKVQNLLSWLYNLRFRVA